MRLSDLLSDYHSKLIDAFRRRKPHSTDRRSQPSFTAAEVIDVINDRFQVLILTVLDLERHEEVQQVQVNRSYDPYVDESFRSSRLRYFSRLYPKAGNRQLLDLLDDEHQIWQAGNANDTTLLPGEKS